MPTMDDLHVDGLELLGELTLGVQTRVGDAGALLGGGGESMATRPGAWTLVCRPLEEDPDLLEEVVAFHTPALPRFYERYDGAVRAAALPISSGRYVIAGASDLIARLEEMIEVEADALPWVMDDAVVVAGVRAEQASLLVPPGGDAVELFSLLLTRPLRRPASPSAFRAGFEPPPPPKS